MVKRFISIWFSHLITDWFTLREPTLSQVPFVLSAPDHGRLLITAANPLAEAEGVNPGMAVADARAAIPSLKVLDDQPALYKQLLERLAGWCIRYTPFVAIDPPNGLLLDVTGCAHLWGGEAAYLTEILKRIQSRGYHIRAAIADTPGAAWAVARFHKKALVIEPGKQVEALLTLPPSALRLELDVIERLAKLGIRRIEQFISIPRAILRRRFGQSFITKLDQALGYEEEMLQPVEPVEPYQERLPCLEAILTATGIEMALRRLLETLCNRLQQEEKGLRVACFKAYRVDGLIVQVDISTHRPSRNVQHLYKLFEMKLPSIEPGEGIEVFVLTAMNIEAHAPVQEKLWDGKTGMDDERISELVDRLAGKFSADQIKRFLPDEHYWPERSYKRTSSLDEKPTCDYRIGYPRPLHLLPAPERIIVTAPIPDYPPMLFRYKGKLHKILKADGPERIEQEWWLQAGEHRDYYRVEDETGCRYWLYRSGHYDAEKQHQWFIHGFFA